LIAALLEVLEILRLYRPLKHALGFRQRVPALFQRLAKAVGQSKRMQQNATSRALDFCDSLFAHKVELSEVEIND